MGYRFKKRAVHAIEKAKAHTNWAIKAENAQRYLDPTYKVFPQFIEELHGYADGAGVAFPDLWTKSLEDELNYYTDEKCTTIVTNGGLLISHNEDWDANSKDAICVIKKTIRDLTIFELFYFNTLGGNSISVNSHGIVQSINTLTHTDWRIGIPRNVIARWMSETNNPAQDYIRLQTLQRSLGYNHVLVDRLGTITNIECTSIRQKVTHPHSPFIHTNHYLGQLVSFEGIERNGKNSTFNRFEKASLGAKLNMSVQELIDLNSNNADGVNMSIFNERTIAKMIVDVEHKKVLVWMRRERELGWIEYPIDGISS